MRIFRIIIILFFALSILQTGYAQESKLVILNLKKGYPVKGKIIEQTTNSVKIESIDGEVFEYKADEISSIADAQESSSKSIFSEIKAIPQINKKGDKIFGIGIGSTSYHMGGSEKMILPLIPVSFEYILKNDLVDNKLAIGIGGLGEYYGTKSSIGDWTTTIFLFTARGYAHYSVIKKLDTYAGLSLGYYYVNVGSSKYDISASGKGSTSIDYFLGCRYYFNKRLGGMVELGSGISWLTFGLAIKM